MLLKFASKKCYIVKTHNKDFNSVKLFDPILQSLGIKRSQKPILRNAYSSNNITFYVLIKAKTKTKLIAIMSYKLTNYSYISFKFVGYPPRNSKRPLTGYPSLSQNHTKFKKLCCSSLKDILFCQIYWKGCKFN